MLVIKISPGHVAEQWCETVLVAIWCIFWKFSHCLIFDLFVIATSQNSRETRAKRARTPKVRKVMVSVRCFLLPQCWGKWQSENGDYFSSITIMTPPTRSCKPNAKKKQHVFLEVGLSSHLCVAGFPKYSFLFMHCDDTHQFFFEAPNVSRSKGVFGDLFVDASCMFVSLSKARFWTRCSGTAACNHLRLEGCIRMQPSEALFHFTGSHAGRFWTHLCSKNVFFFKYSFHFIYNQQNCRLSDSHLNFDPKFPGIRMHNTLVSQQKHAR